MARLALRDVCKSFGSRQVLKNISFQVEDGELVTILGPSGCGKTTMLRVIAGIETVDSGEILIGDRVVNDLPPKDRQVAMVFQEYAIYPHMDVFDNIAYGLRAHGAPKRLVDEKVRQAAEMLGLADKIHRSPGELSGGELQRVALCRAIVRDADVFLFDEPLSNLDPKMRAQVRADIVRIHKTLSLTGVFVTHDQVEALTIGSRVILMNSGEIAQIGRPEDLYYEPANTYVASFMGAPGMNLLEARLTRTGERILAEVGDSTLELCGTSMDQALRAFNAAKVDSYVAVILGIRPEDMRFGQSEIPASETNQIRGRLRLIEALGTERALHFSLVGSNKGEEFIVVTPSRASRADLDKEFNVICDMTRVRLFDHETGEAF